jgi:hypothetical protein
VRCEGTCLVFEPLQVAREVVERGVVAQQVVGRGGVRVVVARQVRAHAARPPRREPAPAHRALERARLHTLTYYYLSYIQHLFHY